MTQWTLTVVMSSHRKKPDRSGDVKQPCPFFAPSRPAKRASPPGRLAADGGRKARRGADLKLALVPARGRDRVIGCFPPHNGNTTFLVFQFRHQPSQAAPPAAPAPAPSTTASLSSKSRKMASASSHCSPTSNVLSTNRRASAKGVHPHCRHAQPSARVGAWRKETASQPLRLP